MRKQEQKGKITALYERLSHDDGRSDESVSVENQKRILEDYARKNGFTNVRHFTDDGVRGTTFKRPGLDAMVDEIRAGNVATVIVKDQSRIGRDVVEVGLLKRTFDEYNVRFIAANDNLDTANGFDIMSIFRDVINEWYVADTSRKIKTVFKSRMEKGLRCSGAVPYGYLASKEEKGEWVIDEEAAAVVRRIFRMVIDGKGVYQIADILSEEKVLCPSAYLAAKGAGNRRNNKFEDPYRWWGTTVSYILARVEYMGHTVNFKTFKTCYRDKHRKQAPKEDWKIFENTHEAIIDKTTWETAQKLRRTIRRGDRNKEPNPLTGLLYCGECGAKMYNERSDGDAYHKTPKDNYVCASYRKKTTSCTIHFIRSEIVRDLILDALRNVATYARANKEDFEQLVMQTTSDARKRSLQSGRTELDRIMRRTNELDTLLQKLYEDYALGRLPEKRHAKLSAQYEAEQAQLEQRSAELMEQMNAEQEESVNVDRFMELVDRYTDFTELTTPMLNEFIDKVIVYERRKINRYQYDQRIEIYFNFIGKVTLPEEETEAAPEAPKTLHVASNSSFAPIGDYLSAQGEEAIALPFSKVEELTGKPLCKSAYKYASYWYPAQDSPLSNTIYNAGYDVDRVNLAAGSAHLTKAA